MRPHVPLAFLRIVRDAIKGDESTRRLAVLLVVMSLCFVGVVGVLLGVAFLAEGGSPDVSRVSIAAAGVVTTTVVGLVGLVLRGLWRRRPWAVRSGDGGSPALGRSAGAGPTSAADAAPLTKKDGKAIAKKAARKAARKAAKATVKQVAKQQRKAGSKRGR